MFYCAISGEPPQEPVVSAKSGKVYERRLIVKYINENGTDPITNEKLEESDLIVIKASPDTAPPRPPTHSSIPALLHALQNEWDALVLETFALKQQYNSTRQELSYALYAQDAASRVIARLIRERDASREALSNVQATMGITPTGPAPGEDVEMADEPPATLPKEAEEAINATSDALSAARKKRKFPAGYASAADIKTFTAKHTIPSLHSPSPAGITALALSRLSPSQFLTGGKDKIVQLYDRSTEKEIVQLKGHSKQVNHVAFRERDGDSTLILSGGADKVAKVWAHDNASGDYIPKSTIRVHKGEITGLAVHPTSTILGLASADKTYSLHDLTTFTELFHSSPSDQGFTSLSVHPDGTLLAVGTATSQIQIYDIRSGKPAANLDPEEGGSYSINTLSFSENGYHLLAPHSANSVAIWDLRKQKTTKVIALGEDFTVNKVLYDTSSHYFGVAGSAGGRIFAHKTWEELARFEEGGNMSDLAFGDLGKEIWGSTGREVRIWGLPG